MPNTSGPLVVALLYDGLCTFEFGIVAEVFGLARPEMGESWYRFASCAVEEGPLRAHGGFLLTPEYGLDLVDPADFVVVPGWKGADRRSSSSAPFPHATNRRSPRSSTGCGPTSAHPGRWRAWHRSAA